MQLFDLRLLFDGGIHHFGVDGALLDQHGADQGCRRGFFLNVQGLVQLFLGQGAAAHHHFANAHRDFVLLLLDVLYVVAGAAVGRQDAHFAVVVHKLESVFDGGLGGTAFQLDFVAEVTGLGIHVLGRGQLLGQHQHLFNAPEGAQEADERQRIHAVAQHFGAKTQ